MTQSGWWHLAHRALSPEASRPASPFQAQGEISPGQDIGLRCTTAGFTPPRIGYESFAVPGPLAPLGFRLRSDSCSSARSFVPRFLHAVLTARRSTLPFAHRDQLAGGLSPPSRCPCRALKPTPPPGTGRRSKSPSGKSCSGQSAQEDHDRCGIEKGFCGCDRRPGFFQSRLFRLIQAKKRSTTQRLGWTAKPI